MYSNKNRITLFEIIWKTITIIFAWMGVYLQAALDGGLFKTYVFLYFTIISNMSITIIFIIVLVLRILGTITRRCYIPNSLLTTKYIFTAAMTLTFIVSMCLLAPFKTHADIFSLRNLSLHIFAPAGAIVDYLFFDKAYRGNFFKKCLSGLVVPIIYLVITLLISIKGITYSNGTMFPYYFLDYRSLGWLTLGNGKTGVLWWLIIISIIAFISSLILNLTKIIIMKFKHK